MTVYSYVTALAAVAMLSFASTVPAAAQANDADRVIPAIDSIVAEAVSSGRVAGMSVAVIRGRDTLVLRGYGKADLEFDIPTPARTVYQIGSLTKQFTAAAILQLQERGALSLDDDITKHLPAYPTQGHRVTLRQLLYHTSGIRSYSEMRELWGFAVDAPRPDSLVALFAAQPFDYAPGAAMTYNNSGYYLLGRVIERASGIPYDEYVQQNLFSRAGMPDSRYCSRSAVVPRGARGYYLDDDTLRVASPTDPDWPYSAGALCSTAGDLVAWTQALHTGRILGSAAYGALLTPGALVDGTRTRYAMGVAVDSVLGHRAIRHAGGVGGFLSDLTYLPDESLTVVVLINTRGPVDPGAVSRSIIRLVAGDRSPRGQAFAGNPADFVGEYRGLGPGGAHVIRIEADHTGGLSLSSGDEPPRSLTYYGGDTFGAWNPQTGIDERFTFVREGGRITKVRTDGLIYLAVLIRA